MLQRLKRAWIAAEQERAVAVTNMQASKGVEMREMASNMLHSC